MKCEICGLDAPEYSVDTFHTSIEGDLLWVHIDCLKTAIAIARQLEEQKRLNAQA